MPRRKPPLVALALAIIAAAGPEVAAAAAPAPGEGKFDWIRLTSGEWLAGELKYMRNELLEIDSDKLDVLRIKWEDVIELRCSRALTYVFTESRQAVGPATIRDSVVRVQTAEGARMFRLADLVSIIAGQGRERELWSGNLSVGFVARSGNTDQLDINNLANVRREATSTRFDVNFAGNIGELEGVPSVRNQLASSKLDAYLSARVFLTLGSLELYSDEFQNIALRTTASAGAGVFVVKNRELEWFVQTSLGYLSTRYVSVAPGEDITNQGASLIPNTELEWEPVKDLEFDLDYNVNINLSQRGDVFHHLLAVLSIKNLRILDLNTSLTWDHVARPQPRDDGTLPGKNDLRTAFGIGIEF